MVSIKALEAVKMKIRRRLKVSQLHSSLIPSPVLNTYALIICSNVYLNAHFIGHCFSLATPNRVLDKEKLSDRENADIAFSGEPSPLFSVFYKRRPEKSH